MGFSEEQATGIERLELLGDLLGVDVFDNKAPEMTRMGTLESPIPIFTLVSVILSGYKAYIDVLCLSRSSLISAILYNLATHHSPTLPYTPFTNLYMSYQSTICTGPQYPERIVGCTGFPADSHDTNWIRCEVSRKHNRCNECGCGELNAVTS
jgi:hypothetical protein